MADIISFRGVRYNLNNITGAEDVCAPPYDVISEEEQDLLYQKNDYNIVRLILGKEEEGDEAGNNKYTRAAASLDSWIQQEIVQRDEQAAFYIYTQEYTYKSRQYTRRGIIARARIEDYASGTIIPHERTLSKPKEDRLNLLRACRTNLSQIFCLYSDPAHLIDAQIDKNTDNTPLMTVVDKAGITHILTAITDTGIIAAITAEMKDKKLYIADGHHRYETALNYRNEQRKAPDAGGSGENAHDFVMMYCTNMDSEEMTILPYHRMVRDLEDFDIPQMKNRLQECFDIEEHQLRSGNERISHLNSLLEKMNTTGEEHPAFAIYCGNGRLLLLHLKDRDVLKTLNPGADQEDSCLLDVHILHELIFYRILKMDSAGVSKQKNIVYTADEESAMDKVDNHLFQAAFFLNPTKMESLKEVVSAGGTMPQKSTFFYPKLLTGLVINKFDEC